MNDLFPYYSIEHFINQPTEFAITRFEKMAEPEVEDVHKHTFYEILWVDEGKSWQTIGTTPRDRSVREIRIGQDDSVPMGEKPANH